MNISRMLVFFLRLARPGAISLLFHPAHLQIARDRAGGVPGEVLTVNERLVSNVGRCQFRAALAVSRLKLAQRNKEGRRQVQRMRTEIEPALVNIALSLVEKPHKENSVM